MSIPEFNKRGTLDKGIHKCNSNEFLSRFCSGEETIRSKYREVLEQLFAFCLNRGGKSIIIGGSFITINEEPNDLDCILILPNEKCCTIQSNELLCMEGCEIDILVLAESQIESIYSFLNLLSMDKYDIQVGMVEVVLDEEKDRSTWDDYHEYFSVEKLLEARETYINRHVIKGVKKRKVLVTVMNANEYFFLNYEISPVVSAAGWIFAPYVYLGKNILEDYKKFKCWITNLYYMYETEISIFAEGLGTFLVGKYLKEDEKYVKAIFDKIILSKTLLSSNFEWNKEIERHRVNLIINLRDKYDKSIITEKIPRKIEESPLFGKAYKTGFGFKNDNIIEHNYSYTKYVDYFQFQNSIFPMYHMAGIFKENIDEVLWDNLAEIATKNISLTDITFNK